MFCRLAAFYANEIIRETPEMLDKPQNTLNRQILSDKQKSTHDYCLKIKFMIPSGNIWSILQNVNKVESIHLF